MNPTVRAGLVITGVLAAVGGGLIALTPQCTFPKEKLGHCTRVLPDGGFEPADGRSLFPEGETRGMCETKACLPQP